MTTRLRALLLVLLAVATLRQRPRAGRHSLRYTLYLRSPLWRLRRRMWIIAAGGRCENCGHRRQPLTIHHRTYTRLGRERRDDIQVLCWYCHRGVHAGRLPRYAKLAQHTRRPQ
jgi:hypothetical protein